MSRKQLDQIAELDRIEEEVDRRSSAPETLSERLGEVLKQLADDSEHRPRAHRLSGVINNRLKLDRSALKELREAKSRAESASPANYTELAKIGRETAVVYAWRGDDRRAALELLPALAYASLGRDESEIAKIIAEFGRIELEAQRFDKVALLLRLFAGDSHGLKLPEREVHRMKINLCQALNRLGEHEEALQRAQGLRNELAANDRRLRFLVQLEEVRALAGLGRFKEADGTLEQAKEWLTENESEYERSEFLQVETELQELRGGPAAVEKLERLIEEYSDQRLSVKEAVGRRALANALLKEGKAVEACEALALGLRSALGNNLGELADQIRADMLKFAGAEHLEDLAKAIDVIGGASTVDLRFVRLERLGKGGHGEVHRAVDLDSGRQVALKKVDLRALGEEKRLALARTIKTEYAAAQKLDDPQVCRIRDLLMVPEGPIFIVQEFVAGPTLRQLYLDKAEPARLIELLAKVAEALHYIHGKAVVHRDLKPENVIVARDSAGNERPVLIDLGIALVAGRVDELKHFGTVPYVSPEQLRGDTVDGPADVYALGHMIAEIWGGKVPSPFAFFGLGDGGDNKMPLAMRQLVRRMLKTNPQTRYTDLPAIAGRLRNQLARMAAEAAPSRTP
jgi:serine/threonine-protein kinase